MLDRPALLWGQTTGSRILVNVSGLADLALMPGRVAPAVASGEATRTLPAATDLLMLARMARPSKHPSPPPLDQLDVQFTLWKVIALAARWARNSFDPDQTPDQAADQLLLARIGALVAKGDAERPLVVAREGGASVATFNEDDFRLLKLHQELWTLLKKFKATPAKHRPTQSALGKAVRELFTQASFDVSLSAVSERLSYLQKRGFARPMSKENEMHIGQPGPKEAAALLLSLTGLPGTSLSSIEYKATVAAAAEKRLREREHLVPGHELIAMVLASLQFPQDELEASAQAIWSAMFSGSVVHKEGAKHFRRKGRGPYRRFTSAPFRAAKFFDRFRGE